MRGLSTGELSIDSRGWTSFRLRIPVHRCQWSTGYVRYMWWLDEHHIVSYSIGFSSFPISKIILCELFCMILPLTAIGLLIVAARISDPVTLSVLAIISLSLSLVIFLAITGWLWVLIRSYLTVRKPPNDEKFVGQKFPCCCCFPSNSVFYRNLPSTSCCDDTFLAIKACLNDSVCKPYKNYPTCCCKCCKNVPFNCCYGYADLTFCHCASFEDRP